MGTRGSGGLGSIFGQLDQAGTTPDGLDPIERVKLEQANQTEILVRGVAEDCARNSMHTESAARGVRTQTVAVDTRRLDHWATIALAGSFMSCANASG